MLQSVKIHIKVFIKWIGILIFFFPVLTGHASPRDYDFRNFSSEDGLINPFIYSIIQDVQGYLWIGTGDGSMYRYNGFVFEYYSTSDSLKGNFITCGITDGEKLWFGHMNGRISFYEGKKVSPVALPLSKPDRITHLAKSPEGQVWVSTYSDGLLKLAEDSSMVKHYLFKEPTFVLSFVFLNDNELLAGTNTGLLYCRLTESDQIEIIRPVEGIPESKVISIQKMNNNSGFYIATENDGIFKFLVEDNTFRVSEIIPVEDFEFTGIQTVYEDSQSNLWFCSFGNGLIKLVYSDSGEFTKINYYNSSNGFVTNNVKTVYEDREGNIWSGNYGQGLTRLTVKTFYTYTFDKQLYGNDIFSICFDQKYKWIGTENGLIKLDQLTGKIVEFYDIRNGLPKDTVTALYSAGGKDLWIGTEKHGLYRMAAETGRIHKYTTGDGVLENSVTHITGIKEQVYIGTKKGLCSINPVTGTINWYTLNKGGLPHNFINSLHADSENRLWISTRSNTLAYIKDETVNKIPFNAGSEIISVTEDINHRIWVGTNGKGVFLIESDSIINITSANGLLSNYCYSIISDDQNNIWVGHKVGLSMIRASDFTVKPVHHIENITDNYQFNPNSVIRDQQGKIWFGSQKGLISYDPSMEPSVFQAPVLVITAIRINDEETDITDKIILSPGRYKIRIDFLGISLKEPSLVTYQYKLDGWEQWSEITKNTTNTYYQLTEGDYTFILKSSSGDGAVAESPLLNIIIKIPFWKKWWFFPATGLILASLIFIYVKRREYRFLAEKKILEEKVRERTYEIQCQKNEIELQRDLIEKKNASITSSIMYASKIQNTILPPVDLMNKLLPDSFIFCQPRDIVSGDFYWLSKKDHKIIFTVADGTGHGVPGAFMSLLGITLLNEIVNIQGMTNSAAIVTMLRERVIYSLQQGRKDIRTSDGMDIALCVLDQRQNKIQYTGGMNNLVYIRDKILQEVKADSFSVCALTDYPGTFTMKEIECKKGDVFYLFSDGYQDQFGGDTDRKYLRRQFYMTLLEIHELPMLKQKEFLAKKLVEWMKNTPQTDDITVMGVRL